MAHNYSNMSSNGQDDLSDCSDPSQESEQTGSQRSTSPTTSYNAELGLTLATTCLSLLQRREISEQETRIEDRRAEADDIERRSDQLRREIAARRGRLKQRKETLNRARELYDEDVSHIDSRKHEVTDGINRLSSLRKRFAPTRTTLISTLATIFPIDLLSPPDLLFTILSVPLPIPLQPTDPAPPLSLASHREVTDESVATALGYAAQVIQLLATYLGKTLVYPITCCGSRSLIKDNISAMVGPKMFPLFSRGVDTYRFEYAVFLLNKDIETLMVDRDLRALDMRHTLPNLKNLLLTSTDGEGAHLAAHRAPDSPVTFGLETPPRAPSPPALKLTPSSPDGDQSPGQISRELPQESLSPTTSGSATPTPTVPLPSDTGTFSRYSKISIGFPPLPGFLRSRNPSIISRSGPPPSTSGPFTEMHQNENISSDEDADEEHESAGSESGSDDDRRTIKGLAINVEERGGDQGIKVPYLNGAGSANGEAHHEKVSDEGVGPIPAIVAHAG